jgi:hypothetical protein
MVGGSVPRSLAGRICPIHSRHDAKLSKSARMGEAERILSLPAGIATRIQGVFPGTTSNVLGLVNGILPGPGGRVTPGV